MDSSVSSSLPFIETLISRGWCFRDIDLVKPVIVIQTALLDDSCTVDEIESELLNMDLRLVGGKSLPDSIALRKFSHIKGPKVLQISSARDISRSSVGDESGSSNCRRLLRLGLTDGFTEITAVEYSHILSIPDHVVPGTKVRLENKAFVHSGIVCLSPNVITVLGGIVQTLHEEWTMNRKYAGFSRPSLKQLGDNKASGPPQFQKLKMEAPHPRNAKQGRFSYPYESMPKWFAAPKNLEVDIKWEAKKNVKELAGNETERTQIGKAESSESRSKNIPKEVSESIPVQNQGASQKLLQKMRNSNRDGSHSRGRRRKGKGKQEQESQVYTFNEWEESKGIAKPLSSVTNEHRDAYSDEDLARKLQSQFDLNNRTEIGNETDAEHLRRSIFKFERDGSDCGYGGRRARGRGRGRGKRR